MLGRRGLSLVHTRTQARDQTVVGGQARRTVARARNFQSRLSGATGSKSGTVAQRRVRQQMTGPSSTSCECRPRQVPMCCGGAGIPSRTHRYGRIVQTSISRQRSERGDGVVRLQYYVARSTIFVWVHEHVTGPRAFRPESCPRYNTTAWVHASFRGRMCELV